jgi:hypothetical protein
LAPVSTRLTPEELATLSRLQRLSQFAGRTFNESPHLGADYVDDLGRTFDAVGTPSASQYWNVNEFLLSIGQHLAPMKSNDFTVVDLTGFTQEQIRVVTTFINSLPPGVEEQIVRIGF